MVQVPKMHMGYLQSSGVETAVESDEKIDWSEREAELGVWDAIKSKKVLAG